MNELVLEAVTRCHICGSPLTKDQISMRIDGRYVDFEERLVGDISLFFCLSCKTKTIENIKGVNLKGKFNGVR